MHGPRFTVHVHLHYLPVARQTAWCGVKGKEGTFEPTLMSQIRTTSYGKET